MPGAGKHLATDFGSNPVPPWSRYTGHPTGREAIPVALLSTQSTELLTYERLRRPPTLPEAVSGRQGAPISQSCRMQAQFWLGVCSIAPS